MLLFALVRAVEIIGEAATRVSPEARAEAPSVPWAMIVAMRHRLIHAYLDIDRNILWKTVTEEIPTCWPNCDRLRLADSSEAQTDSILFFTLTPIALRSRGDQQLKEPANGGSKRYTMEGTMKVATPVVQKMILTDSWDPKTRELIGQIVIAFAQLEHVLWLSSKRIGKLTMAEWDKIASIVPVPARCQEIREGFGRRHMNQEEEARLESLLCRVVLANDRRNAIVHAIWGCKKIKGSIVSRHRIWRNKDRGINVSELNGLCTEIKTLRDELNDFLRHG